MKIRINKYLASAGVASRRKIDEYVAQSRIVVNGEVATPGLQVDPENDKIFIDNKRFLYVQPKFAYYLLNKPAGVLSTCSDDRDRETVLNFVPNNQRLFPIGRLDCHTSGLIILTNDGDLSLKLTHPRYHLAKTYRLTIQGDIPRSTIQKLSEPLMLEDGPTLPAVIQKYVYSGPKTIIDLTIFQGKNRQIRRMAAALNLELDSLNRIAIGPIQMGTLKVGSYRSLTPAEVESLKRG